MDKEHLDEQQCLRVRETLLEVLEHGRATEHPAGFVRELVETSRCLSDTNGLKAVREKVTRYISLETSNGIMQHSPLDRQGLERVSGAILHHQSWIRKEVEGSLPIHRQAKRAVVALIHRFFVLPEV